MTTPKLKRLLKHSSEIINMYLDSSYHHELCTFKIDTFVDDGEKDSEVVTLSLDGCMEMNDEFLEPVSNYFIKHNVNWGVRLNESNGFFTLVIDIS